MAAFDNVKQQMVTENGIRKELGGAVTIAGVSGQDFTVATKLRKVKSGTGVMTADGLPVVFTTGLVSNGQVAAKRLGPVATSADTVNYTLYGY
jgi:hypothetical protein